MRAMTAAGTAAVVMAGRHEMVEQLPERSIATDGIHTSGWEPPKLVGKEPHEDQAEPERRHTHAKQG